jgi:hypothetical protein
MKSVFLESMLKVRLFDLFALQKVLNKFFQVLGGRGGETFLFEQRVGLEIKRLCPEDCE